MVFIIRRKMTTIFRARNERGVVFLRLFIAVPVLFGTLAVRLAPGQSVPLLPVSGRRLVVVVKLVKPPRPHFP